MSAAIGLLAIILVWIIFCGITCKIIHKIKLSYEKKIKLKIPRQDSSIEMKKTKTQDKDIWIYSVAGISGERIFTCFGNCMARDKEEANGIGIKESYRANGKEKTNIQAFDAYKLEWLEQ